MEYHPLAEKAMKEASLKENAEGKADSSSSANGMMATPANGAQTPPPASLSQPAKPIVRSQKPSVLTVDEIAAFDRDGFLVLSRARVWDLEKELPALLKAVDEMDSWEDAPGKYMKYYEVRKSGPNAGQKILQRIENFTQFSPVLERVLQTGKVVDMCSDLFDEKSILYKEKINFKLAGGDGFLPHQDVAAGWWMYGQSLHISMLISVDASNKENGALEVVRGQHRQGILGEPWKEVPQTLVDQYKWEMVSTQPGDVVFFDSFVPHRSAPNTSSSRRRILYSTYAKASEGDFRDRYYADKRKSFPPDCERDASKKYEYKI